MYMTSTRKRILQFGFFRYITIAPKKEDSNGNLTTSLNALNDGKIRLEIPLKPL